MKWICANGEEIDITKMSDAHLENALLKSIEQRKDRQTIILDTEQKRRKKERYFNQTRACPFCSGVMKPHESFPKPEVGWQLPSYRFCCEQCGATSDKIKGP